jgi:hypothetical protein
MRSHLEENDVHRVDLGAFPDRHSPPKRRSAAIVGVVVGVVAFVRRFHRTRAAHCVRVGLEKTCLVES